MSDQPATGSEQTGSTEGQPQGTPTPTPADLAAKIIGTPAEAKPGTESQKGAESAQTGDGAKPDQKTTEPDAGKAEDTVEHWREQARKWEKRARRNDGGGKPPAAPAGGDGDDDDDAAQREIADLKRQLKVSEIATAKGVPADRLHGDTLDDVEDYADGLLKIAAEKKVPVGLLQGASLEQVAAFADQLIAWKGKTPAMPVVPQEGTGGGAKPNDEAAEALRALGFIDA